jgi:hypothetical protein
MDEKDAVCEEVIVNGFKYQKGDLVVIKVLDGGDKLKVGIIKTILDQRKDRLKMMWNVDVICCLVGA